jgi:Tfp pilus assembly ATPase PilU
MKVPGTKKMTDYSKEITKLVEQKYKLKIPEALTKDILKTFEQNLYNYIILKSDQKTKEEALDGNRVKYHFKLSLQLKKENRQQNSHHSHILYFRFNSL